MNPKNKLGFLKGREKDKDHKGKNKDNFAILKYITLSDGMNPKK